MTGGFSQWSRVALAAAWLMTALGTAQAHNVKLDLELWGNFPGEGPACQRVIGRATAQCIANAISARAACHRAELRGGQCDQAAMDAAVQSARARALNQVEANCTIEELNSLGFMDIRDAETDVISACRELDTAAETAVFGPSMLGTIGSVDSDERACMNQAGAAVSKLLRTAFQARENAFGHMASGNLSLHQKQALLRRAGRRIARAVNLLEKRVQTWCSNDGFAEIYGRTIRDFLEAVGQRSDCLSGWTYAQKEVLCPAAECGNGIKEPNEECDDGNDNDSDSCRNDCIRTNCEIFPSTYDLIQRAIFENRGCTNDLCHGTARQAGLDLRAGASYDNLVDVGTSTVNGWLRVNPGSRETSLLWRILAAKTDPADWGDGPFARPMPADPYPAISGNELEALRLWILHGASRTATVEGTGDLLNACLPPAEPIEIPPLAPPSANEGVQWHMPAWELGPESESEVCFSSYYDFTGKIPAEYLSADRKRFRYRKIEMRQNPLSHHLIVDVYRGNDPANAPIWGPYTCKGGDKHGDPCDPLALGFCGEEGDCATEPDPTAVACIGFGPQTGFNALTRGGVAFAQETTTQFDFPDGVYEELPLQGVILWNSHAFNVTKKAGKLEGWVNIYFPKREEQRYQQIQIFNATKIFWTPIIRILSNPLPALAAFEKFEICHIHSFDRPDESPASAVVRADQTVNLFELSGHMHEHGKRFQIFRGAFTCAGGANAGVACSPNTPAMCPESTCTEATGRNPATSLLYTNFIYNDPVVVRFDPPMQIAGSASRAERSLTFCAVYDNGATNMQDVKRRSTSPEAGTILGIPLGGPCSAEKTRCIGGPHHNELCHGDDAFCDSPTGGDGDCDACPLTGGFRTKDEMFILFGNFWVQ